MEIKSLTFFLEFLKGARKIALVYFISIVSFIVIGAGVFIIAVQGLNQFRAEGVVYLDVALMTGLVFLVLGMSVMFWALSEKRWLNAFGLQSHYKRVLRSPTYDESHGNDTLTVSQVEIEQLVNALVEKKINEVLDKKTKDDHEGSPKQNETETRLARERLATGGWAGTA